MSKQKSELTVTELKQRLSKMPVDEVNKLLIECFKASKEAKSLISIKLLGDQAVTTLMENYKKIIENELLPARGFGKLRLTVAKKAISDFKKISQNNRLTIDLMIFYVEMGVNFIDTYGGASDSLMNSICAMFDSVIDMLNKEDNLDIFLEYKDRIENIINKSEDLGWGIQDLFQASYCDINWLDDDEDDEENITAEEKWLRIHTDIRNKYLQNVWCATCGVPVTIVEYQITDDKHGILLEGKCKNCSHDVARLVEMP